MLRNIHLVCMEHFIQHTSEMRRGFELPSAKTFCLCSQILPPGPAERILAPASVSPEHWRTQYSQIGAALSAAEASFWNVGIPWIPPTAAVRSLRVSEPGGSREYLRLGLVGVSTPVIDAYVDDLLHDGDVREMCSGLSIRQPTRIEKIGFAGLCSLGGMLTAGCLAFLLGATASSLAGLSVIGFAAAFVCSSAVSEDGYRRRSFARVLLQESCRRKGMDPSGGSGLQISTAMNN